MAKYPVVVYGASGYTGMLTMDWLIDQNIPFTAVARDGARVKKMMAERVVRLESATYEILEAQHDVESLTRAFSGAKVVCNTVGPFVRFGLAAVEAALKAGCHHIDTTGAGSFFSEFLAAIPPLATGFASGSSDLALRPCSTIGAAAGTPGSTVLISAVFFSAGFGCAEETFGAFSGTL